MSEIIVKRIYDKDLPDGYRILIDRVWPRGMSKVRAQLDLWAKNIAPTPELRKWFSHDPEKFPEFKEKYINELNENPDTAEFLKTIEDALKSQDVLLLYGSKEQKYNNAAVMIDYLNKKIAK
ncbi:DUF488 domain-containing protein [Companilactobacillus mishanensis]|uniref:DUF488 family protein n=1 Tax=Companilactobacillus mishanensis TaxID=2486008 RepID=A0A5P0ZJW3_9LACO|nr:DUF488 family protein [Companilactobacillus mishanensis]MQS45540.1 DUF488 family protein [Companilactobacillus mishanensis]MQS53380.1 DUF488 family protein [Companilactobacillus mishanensis]MQS89269.1 DUF488 family protein [Companilactobacillus mishanensis]